PFHDMGPDADWRSWFRRKLKEDEYIRSMVSGAISGLTAAVLVTPLDVTKVRLQNQVVLSRPPRSDIFSTSTAAAALPSDRAQASGTPAPPPRPKYRGTLRTLRLIHREEGFRGLYSGLTPSVLAYIPDRAIWFTLYHESKIFIGYAMAREVASGWAPADGSLSNNSIVIASSIAKCAASLATYPHEVLRTRLQTQTTSTHLPIDDATASDLAASGEPVKAQPKYRGILQTAKVMIAEEGWVSMYRGLTTSLWTYEFLFHQLGQL
ncbi:hypothetical protein HK405_010493, partial [Cladochytrium tenue]